MTIFEKATHGHKKKVYDVFTEATLGLPKTTKLVKALLKLIGLLGKKNDWWNNYGSLVFVGCS